METKWCIMALTIDSPTGNGARWSALPERRRDAQRDASDQRGLTSRPPARHQTEASLARHAPEPPCTGIDHLPQRPNARTGHGQVERPRTGSDLPAAQDSRYHVSITLHRERDPVRVTLALTEAFSQGAPTPAMPSALSPQAARGDVEVDFEFVRADPAADGEGSLVEQLPFEQLARLEVEASALVPAMKALLALSGARRRARLAPQHRMTIEVAPEGAHQPRWDEIQEL